MARKDVRQQLEALKQHPQNLAPQDIERVAKKAGWVHDRTTGGHSIYTKEGFWANLSIPQHSLKGWTAKRLLNVIESSLYEEEEENERK